MGTTSVPSGYTLAVDGKAIMEEVKVAASNNWPDFVFTKEYNLPSIQETAEYINQNGHLPDIPSAEEVEENGISLGEMDAKLLQKIEELTLHTIRQETELETKAKEIVQLKAESEKLKAQIAELFELKLLVMPLLEK